MRDVYNLRCRVIEQVQQTVKFLGQKAKTRLG